MVNYSVTSAGHQRNRPRVSPMVRLGQLLFFWLGIGLGTIGLIWLTFGWLKGQAGRLWPVSETISLMMVDPSPGSVATPWLLQLQPQTKTVTVLALPADQTTELFSGYGNYKLPAVYPLLALDRRSPAYIRASFSAISQVLITEVVPWLELPNWQSQVTKMSLFSEEKAHDQGRELGRLPFRDLTKMHWKKIWSSDLNWSDRVQNFKAWKLAWQWRLFTEQADIRWVWTTDPKLLLTHRQPATDQCPIAVVNTTEIKGLARHISEVLTANGYTTVRTTVAPETDAQSQVWLDPAAAGLCQRLADHVSTVLPAGPKPQFNAEITKLYRAPIVIVVGGDITR